MEALTKTQRRRANRKRVDSSVIRVEVTDRIGSPSWVTADVVDIIDGGFGVNSIFPLNPAPACWCAGNRPGTGRRSICRPE